MKRITVVLSVCCILSFLLLSGCSNTECLNMEQEIRDITHSAAYSAEVWNNLGIRERWDLLVSYEREVEKAMDLEPVYVVPILDNRCTYGTYSHSERTIYLSEMLLLHRDSALDTVRHELRHYYQNLLCDELRSHAIGTGNIAGVDLKIIIIWNEGREKEISYSGGPEFFTQPLEADAYAWEDLTG